MSETLKKLPRFATEADLERFVHTADLTQYDLRDGGLDILRRRLERDKSMRMGLQKLPSFATDEEAVRFVANADLSKYDLSGGRPLSEVFPELAAKMKRPRGRPRAENALVAVTLRLDPRAVERFKATGKDWRNK